MAAHNFNNRTFKGVVNYDSGDLTGDTRFHYYQDGDDVWGTFEGGNIVSGAIKAKMIEDGKLDMEWWYTSSDGEEIKGVGSSTPELLSDGRYKLHESWTVTETSSGAGVGVSGTSVIEELRPD
ncbi:MAG: n-acetylglutamate synthase [bacterium]|nr:n-acetylglutamate synthase [bacterium]